MGESMLSTSEDVLILAVFKEVKQHYSKIYVILPTMISDIIVTKYRDHLVACLDLSRSRIIYTPDTLASNPASDQDSLGQATRCKKIKPTVVARNKRTNKKYYIITIPKAFAKEIRINPGDWVRIGLTRNYKLVIEQLS